jgi:hypothetical protein
VPPGATRGFIASNNDYIPFLLREADRIDQYLNQH